MSKGKYTIKKRYLNAINKMITDNKEILPQWLKEIKKEQERDRENREKDRTDV